MTALFKDDANNRFKAFDRGERAALYEILQYALHGLKYEIYDYGVTGQKEKLRHVLRLRGCAERFQSEVGVLTLDPALIPPSKHEERIIEEEE